MHLDGHRWHPYGWPSSDAICGEIAVCGLQLFIQMLIRRIRHGDSKASQLQQRQADHPLSDKVYLDCFLEFQTD